MMVNLVLGSVLWTTYSEASSALESHIQSPIPLAGLSGAMAGGAQALVAAPAENVRSLLEGGSPATGWSYAWKEVFRGTRSNLAKSKRDELHEARQVRDWMRDVSDMAGRGWDGWKWGVAKDACGTVPPSHVGAPDSWTSPSGFAVFFSIFEITRRFAITAKELSQTFLQQQPPEFCRRPGVQKNGPRITHAMTLVTGGAVAGFAYEVSCRPWEAARKALRVDRVVAAHEHHSALLILLHKARTEGWLAFFRQAGAPDHETYASPLHRRLNTLLRTLGRVGPWGVGFLVWEAFGPGLA